ncbi:MAG: hypothetical protein SFZ24_05065 [Planctomycetota bacterium]|nr:hypothetical protein [Planctomycetota bacterium]
MTRYGTRAAALALLAALAAPATRADPSREQMSESLRAVDAADRSLASPEAVERVRAMVPEGRPPDPAELFEQAAAQPRSPDVALDLADAVERWHAHAERIGTPRLVLVGWASPERLEAARVSWRAVAALAAAATSVIDRAVEAHDVAAVPGADVDPNVEDAIAQLVHRRQVVVPLRSARAAAFLALSGADEGPERQELARRALELARRVQTASVWAEAERASAMGLASLALGEVEEAQARFEEALASISDQQLPEALRAGIRSESTLGRVLALARSRGAVTAGDALRDELDRGVFSGVTGPGLEASLAAAHLLLTLAPKEAAQLRDQDRRDAVLARAVARFESIASQLGQPGRRLVVHQLSLRLGESWPLDTLPPIATLARAATTPPGNGPQALAALRALEAALDRPGVSEPDAADLIEQHARLAPQSGVVAHIARATELCDRFVSRYPEDERRGLILDAAARAASALDAMDPSSDGSRTLDALRAIRDAAFDVPSREQWGMLLARTLSGRMTAADPASVRSQLNEAERTLTSISDQALVGPAWMAQVEALGSALRALRDADPRAPVGDITVGESLPALAQRLIEVSDFRRAPQGWLAASSPMERAQIQAVRALGLLVAGRPADALDALEPSLSAEAVRGPVRARGQALALEAYAALGRESDARAALDALDAGGEIDASATLQASFQRHWRTLAPRVPTSVGGDKDQTPAPGVLARLMLERGAPLAERVRSAWMLLESGDAPGSAAAFEALLAQPQTASAEALVGLGEARLRTPDDAGAFAAFREATQSLEAARTYDAFYFHAWARMLEILLRTDPSPAGRASVEREAQRLADMPQFAHQAPESRERIRGAAGAASGAP